MKAPYSFLFLFLCIMINACGNANQINGHSMQTALKSVSRIKDHLPVNQRIEFEVAYWELRNQNKDDVEFLKVIDQKTPADIIGIAKANFAKNKTAGASDVAAYDNWEQMIAKQIEQRGAQDRSAVDPKDKKAYPRVDYKMHSM